ncbi:MAG TPA: DedA family protein [Rubrobacteraceae bacterium]|jgi:membrane protein DedA with SNARE-associated domain|nr:DedA family protein [Rubrobacteraceae bacterium]
MQDLLANIGQWCIEVVYSLGYLGVTVLSALSSLNLPVPMPLILSLAGFLVEQGTFSFVPVVMASATGAMIAALVLYIAGFWFDEARLRRVIRRFEQFGLIFESDYDKVSREFERHRGIAILICHLLPIGGGLISIPAGLKRMPIRWFMLYTFIGCAIWNGAFVVFGWMLGTQWAAVQEYATIVERTTLVALIAVVLWFLWRRWKPRSSSGP